MGGPPLWQHRIKCKAGVVLGLIADGSGVTAIEYGLIAALIAIAAIAMMSLVGTNLTNTFSTVASDL